MDAFAIIDSFNFSLVVKLMFVVLLLVYSLFAMLMMRQISSLTKAVQMKDDYIIRGLGILHFGFAMIVLVIALLVRT